MNVRYVVLMALSLLICTGCTCKHTSAPLPASQASASELQALSGDVVALREVMQTGVDPRKLGGRFRIVQSTHADYFGPSEEIGGEATSVMNWFFADDGFIYRVHYDGRIASLENPQGWVNSMRPANKIRISRRPLASLGRN